MTKPTTVTNSIRQLRLEHKGMTQAELASQVGVTRQRVNPIEQGKYSPSPEVAFQIAGALGCKLDEVFDYPTSR